ncbi:hypothetical protein [Hyphomicrobium sp.]|uniref:hypothetical protein n=1 Tax=Hyphomicrobium sp. TaxID=82 RepID=UPI0025C49577|nr:hypothetical protein [Hyphomicrobium sp.]
MEHSSLVAFLNGDLSPEAFCSEIAAEVDACEQEFKSEGVGYVVVTDGPAEVVTRDQVWRLLQALLDGRLPFLSANYAADCLVMSDAFEFADKAVAEAIAFVADGSRPPTPKETEAALAALDYAQTPHPRT